MIKLKITNRNLL